MCTSTNVLSLWYEPQVEQLNGGNFSAFVEYLNDKERLTHKIERSSFIRTLFFS